MRKVDPLPKGLEIGWLTVVGAREPERLNGQLVRRIELRCRCGERVVRREHYLRQVLSDTPSFRGVIPRCARCAVDNRANAPQSDEHRRRMERRFLVEAWESYGSLYPTYWAEHEIDCIIDELEAAGLGRPRGECPKPPLAVDMATEGMYSERRDLVDYNENWAEGIDFDEPLREVEEYEEEKPPKRARTLAEWAGRVNRATERERVSHRERRRRKMEAKREKAKKEENLKKTLLEMRDLKDRLGKLDKEARQLMRELGYEVPKLQG